MLDLSINFPLHSTEYCFIAIFITWLKIWVSQLHCTTVSVIACTIEIRSNTHISAQILEKIWK